MTRLLHAAARGARLDYQPLIEDAPEWMPLTQIPLLPNTDWDRYRIHLADEYLAYGPISTALREGATGVVHAGQAITYINWEAEGEVAAYEVSELHRSLFLLILAEALADEGM
ncbi:MAG: hypothetical protein HXX17_08040 [Geobacteraceae bacterium]|nr:hypothetical protein [Geobacteraceae bacterium]